MPALLASCPAAPVERSLDLLSLEAEYDCLWATGRGSAVA